MINAVRKPLRLWPGVVIGIMTLAVRFGFRIVAPDAAAYGLLGGVVGGLALVLWWLFFSRAPWIERLGAVVLMPLALYGTSRIVHVSIAKGAMGMLLPLLAIPMLGLAFITWALVTRGFSDGLRRTTMVATILFACGVWALVRTGGVSGNYSNDLHWRWSQTPEERLVAQSSHASITHAPEAIPEPAKTPDKPIGGQPAAKSINQPSVIPPAAAGGAPAPVGTSPEWPGFRGPQRDAIIRGLRIKTDWSASPPALLWRRPVGPGWSSFAVHRDLLYTQEQRGPDEIVSCYKVATGEPVWTHRDTARFYESNAGPGPRGTPTLSDGRVYALGATGILNALDAGDGTSAWSRDSATDTGMKAPQWGFASSPLAIDRLVIVAAAGRLVAYDTGTGAPRWFGPSRGASYSSPHLRMVDGVAGILLLSEFGATCLAAADGAQLWEYAWKGYPIVQPALTPDGDILMSVSDKSGTRRIAVEHGPDGWIVRERWTSSGLKPYFNDFVVHNGHAFGFDGSILACIDLKDGSRKWKGGRYGNGQLVLLPDQDLMLVLSEEGELALVRATPDQFTELARIPGIEGKTWNHPVLAGDVLLVRNDQEMAAFRLALAGK